MQTLSYCRTLYESCNIRCQPFFSSKNVGNRFAESLNIYLILVYVNFCIFFKIKRRKSQKKMSNNDLMSVYQAFLSLNHSKWPSLTAKALRGHKQTTRTNDGEWGYLKSKSVHKGEGEKRNPKFWTRGLCNMSDTYITDFRTGCKVLLDGP